MKPKRIRSPRIVFECASEFRDEVTHIARERKFKSMSAMVMFALQKYLAEIKQPPCKDKAATESGEENNALTNNKDQT